MFEYLFWGLLALIGLGVVVAALTIWEQIRDTLAAWLRQLGLETSALMEALVHLDAVAGQVRCRLLATTRQTGQVTIDEATYQLDQIDDPTVLAELRQRGFAARSVLHLVS